MKTETEKRLDIYLAKLIPSHRRIVKQIINDEIAEAVEEAKNDT